MIQARLRKRFAPSRESAEFTLDVEFRAGAGVTVLFGPSGAGKTLTLDCIAGFLRPDEGRLLLDDTLLFDAASGVNLPPQRRQCGYVFQNYALFPNMTLRENLAFAADRRPRLERHRKVNEMIERFRLADVAGRRPHEVSGGQKQRCSIARALIGAPRLLLLDEPARGLDAVLRQELYEVLRQVRAEFSLPVLLVTHDLEECFELGEEMLILRDGRIVQSGAPARILDQPANLEVARLLGLFNLLPVEIKALDPGAGTSQLKIDDAVLQGPYFPGRLRGDRLWLFIRPDQLRAYPHDGKAGANRVAGSLVRATERAQHVRLEFASGVAVHMPRQDFEPHKHNRDWLIEFPSQALRVL